MSYARLEPHKVDHLFLLVGENPLPNYVSARLLLKPEGIAHLVYSTGTMPAFNCLSEALAEIGIRSFPISLGASEADAEKIQKEIRQHARNCQGRIGLNYTGGTKTMAVHAYQAIRQQFPDPSSDLCFSYLDSRNFRLCIDGKAAVHNISLALNPSPTLEQILKLHNLSWDANNLPIRSPQVPDGAEALAKFFSQRDYQVEKSWKDWCKQKLGNAKTKKGWKEESKLFQLPAYSLTTLPKEILEIFQKHLKTSETELDLRKVKRACSSFTELSHICHWLDNGWLEAYTLCHVQAIATQFALHDSAMSIHITDPRNPNRGDQFEFDVAFLRGYQLFAISCTTSPAHAECKQKLFEAQLRARQLGGDEARVALVSFYDQTTDLLKQEMSFLVDDRRIEIFGRRDLPPKDFRKKLTDWIQRNIGT